MTPAEIAALAGIDAVPAQESALRTFITAFDSEGWTQLSTDTFTIPDAALRGRPIVDCKKLLAAFQN